MLTDTRTHRYASYRDKIKKQAVDVFALEVKVTELDYRVRLAERRLEALEKPTYTLDDQFDHPLQQLENLFNLDNYRSTGNGTPQMVWTSAPNSNNYCYSDTNPKGDANADE